MERAVYTRECRRRGRLGIEDLVPHKQNTVHTIASRRVHFDPLSSPAGIHNFKYTSHLDEENASGPLCANGGPEGGSGDEAMRGSLRASQDVHNRWMDYGSTSAVGAEPM